MGFANKVRWMTVLGFEVRQLHIEVVHKLEALDR